MRGIAAEGDLSKCIPHGQIYLSRHHCAAISAEGTQSKYVISLKGLIFIFFMSVGALLIIMVLQTFDYQKQSVKGVFFQCFVFIGFLGYSAKNKNIVAHFFHLLNRKKLDWLPIDKNMPKRNQVLPEPEPSVCTSSV